MAELAVLLTRAAPGIGWALWRAVSTPEPEAQELPAADAALGREAARAFGAPVFGPPEPVAPA